MNVPDSSRLQPSSEPVPTRPADLAGAQPRPSSSMPAVAPLPQPPKPDAPAAPIYARAPEVAEFAARVRRMSEVRSDVIEAVRELLNAGQYDTRESAEATAQRLLKLS